MCLNATGGAAFALTSNPIDDLVGWSNGKLEIGFAPDRSLAASGAYQRSKIAGNSDLGVQGLLAWRRYLQPGAHPLSGPYLAGGAEFDYSEETTPGGDEGVAFDLYLDGIAGVKFPLGNRFLVDLSGRVGLPLAQKFAVNGDWRGGSTLPLFPELHNAVIGVTISLGVTL